MSRRSSAASSRSARGRFVPLVSAGIAAVLVTSGLAALTESSAGAATPPLSQSVGRFVDGSVGGNPIQQLADVHDARAVNPGTTSAQNPLDATLLGQLEVPLGNALKLPGGGAFTLGAANQVAVAKSDGYSYGASGAVSNSGGISLGGNDKSFPAGATIDLSAASLGSVTIPGLPAGGGDTTAAALGGVSATIGAVSALAQTKSGGDPVTPQYAIAGLSLKLGSPALGALLKQLAAGSTALQALIDQLKGLVGALLPTKCDLLAGTLPSTISLDKGAITIDPATATVTVDLAKLLQVAHLNINALPANTDLIAYLVANLPDILSSGLESIMNGITEPLTKFGDCLSSIPLLGGLTQQLLNTLITGQGQLETAINQIVAQLSSAGAPGLKMLTDQLAKVVAIGVNVESGPGKAADNSKYLFDSALAATPDQATPVVSGQTLVRAIEIDLLGGQVASLALANAAAGPSTPAVAPPTSSPAPTTTVPGTVIPTGVPAGQGPVGGGTPVLPIVLLVLGLLMAAGAGVTWRLRGGRHLG